MKNKSCFNCKNQNICKHRDRIFDKFEFISWIEDTSGFVSLIAKAIGERCKYYIPYSEQELKERGITE